MNQEEIIRDLLLQKYQRQKRLNEQFKDLEELEIELSIERFGRFFGTSYLVTKRVFTLLIGIGLCLLALVLLIQPDLIFNDTTMDELVKDSREDYLTSFTQTVTEAWVNLNAGELRQDGFIQMIEAIIDQAIKKDLESSIKVLGYLLLVLGLIIIYVSRLTKKMRIRNSRISRAQNLTKELIKEFKDYIEEDEKELTALQEMVDQKQN